MGGDFLPRPERPGLAFGFRTRTTFAPEIEQKHIGSWIKRKGKLIGVVMDKQQSGRKRYALGEFQKMILEDSKYRSHSLKLNSHSYCLTAQKDLVFILIFAKKA